MSARRYSSDKTRGQNVRCHRSGLLASKKADFKKHPFGRCGCHDIPHGYHAPFISPTELKTPCNPGCCNLLWQRYPLGMGCLNDDKWWSMWAWSLRYFSYHEFRSANCVFGTRVVHVLFLSRCLFNYKRIVPYGTQNVHVWGKCTYLGPAIIEGNHFPSHTAIFSFRNKVYRVIENRFNRKTWNCFLNIPFRPFPFTHENMGK